MKKILSIHLFLIAFTLIGFGQEADYLLKTDLQYYAPEENKNDPYIAERCVLDIYYPTNKTDFPTIVWFHGGGLTGGNKYIPDALKNKGVAIIAVNYRLYPKIKAPVYIQDAAASVAWTFNHIQDFGGDPSLIFLSGHSAGGYLASMVGMDKRWLAAHDIDANQLAGLVPFSGHTITHFTVRDERDIAGTRPIIDDLAPLYHVRKDAPPLLLITGDRELELLGRYEENAYMYRMMQVVGHPDTRIMEMDGYGHGMTEPAFPLLVKEVNRITNIKKRPNIVFIIADDASWVHFGPYGNPNVSTPNIDKLAKEGVIFENAFVSTSSCTPSRGAVLTGRNGFELEEGATLWGSLPAKFPTYPELLNKNGYRIGATGKGWGPGFLVDRELNPAGQLYNMVTHNPYRETFNENPESPIHYAGNFESFLTTSKQTSPFCFWLGTFEPHRGYKEGFAQSLKKNCDLVEVPDFLPNTPEVRNDICEYLAEIEHIDKQVGEVLEILKRKNKLKNTLIIVTSDNGMPFPRAKATMYDYGTRMPLIAWWGDKIKGGRKVSDLISFTDIAPTILKAAKVNVPWSMSGKSFLNVLQSDLDGRIDTSRNQVFMYRERHTFLKDLHGETFPMRAIRTHKHLLIWNMKPDVLPKDIDGGPSKTFMEDHKNDYEHLYDLSFGLRPEYELYNIQSDPFQMNNLAFENEHSQTLSHLKSKLTDYLKERKDPRSAGILNPFKFNPYYGILFERNLVKWSPDQFGQNISAQERLELFEKAFNQIGASEYFAELVKIRSGNF